MSAATDHLPPLLGDLTAGLRRSAARLLAAAAQRSDGQPDPLLGHTDAGRQVVVPRGVLTEHIFAAGATGAGKTTTCSRIAASTVCHGGPCLVIDLKGDPALAKQLRAWARQAGREFLWWQVGRQQVRYDVLAGGDASEQASRLMRFSEWTEPHYKSVAEDLVALAIRVAHAIHEHPTLPDVVRLLDPHRLADEAARSPRIGQLLAREVDEETANLPRDQASAVAGLRRRLRRISRSTAGPAMVPAAGHRAINLREVMADGGPVVVCSLNSMRYGDLAAQIAALVLEDAAGALGARMEAGRWTKPGLLWVDEFESIGGDRIHRLLARSRAAGVGVMLSTQDVADLRAASEELPSRVAANVRTMLLHEIRSPESAEWLADVIATALRWRDTVQVDKDWIGVQRPTGAGSRRQVHGYVIHPTELKRLGKGRCIVLRHTDQAGPPAVDHCQVTPLQAPPGADTDGPCEPTSRPDDSQPPDGDGHQADDEGQAGPADTAGGLEKPEADRGRGPTPPSSPSWLTDDGEEG